MPGDLTPDRIRSYTGGRPDLLALMPNIKGTFVVDVGSSNGAFGAQLQTLGATCVGVEMNSALAKESQSVLHRVVVGDALSGLAQLHREGLHPSVVTFADVLEHLEDPWSAVDHAVALMPCGGWIVASVPNVAYWDTLVSLLRGTWPMRERGIHDDTHLRFFARRDLVRLFERPRSRIVQINRTYRLIERPHPVNRLAPLVGWIWPNLMTFQYVVRVRVAPFM